jgi:hypothetical protein
VTAGRGIKPVPPTKPKEYPLPANPVKACKDLILDAGANPGSQARQAARLDGAPGTVLVLADSNYWAACDTAYARDNGKGSLREPAKLGTPPASTSTFAVANNILSMQGKLYEYYWAAGRLPSGVAKITYSFPDGGTANAVVQGKYWLMQHRDPKPWVEGTGGPDTPKVTVTLHRANGSVLKTLKLAWGTDTCAQTTHGC